MLNNSTIAGCLEAMEPPFYIYDGDSIAQRIARVQKAFPKFSLLYSVKANPYDKILNIMREAGVGIDAASGNEVLLAKGLGFRSEDIYYSSPGKTRRDILSAMEAGTLIADSIHELDMLNAIAEEQNRALSVGMRLNLPNPHILKSKKEIMGGHASKFGIDPQTYDKNRYHFHEYKHLRIQGIHVYFGSQILEEEILFNNFNTIATYALEMAKDLPLTFVNFGGGFGIPYAEEERDLALESVAERIHSLPAIQELLSRGVRCNLELGRYFVGDCGLFVAEVVDKKESFGETYVILNAGMNSFFRPMFTHDYHAIRQMTVRNEMEQITVVGNLCTPIDEYYKGITLPAVEIGDILAFENAGAYGYSMSLLDFISHDRPSQIMLIGGEQVEFH